MIQHTPVLPNIRCWMQPCMTDLTGPSKKEQQHAYQQQEQPNQSISSLASIPSCPATQVLSSDLGILSNYADLSPTEQALHSFNSTVIQLAYSSWVADVQQQLGGCLEDCGHTHNVRNMFTASGRGDVRLHSGFFKAWQALEGQVTAAINRQLLKVDENKHVYFIGHSLGGRLPPLVLCAHTIAGTAPAQPTRLRACGCLAAPRVLSRRQVFGAVSHSSTGLVNGVLEPRGSERLDCGILSDVPDLSVRTHWLGSYLDAWRQHYLQATGRSLAGDVHMGSIMCAECSLSFLNLAKQMNVPARAGRPVTCAVHASCNSRRAWDAVALLMVAGPRHKLELLQCS
ncbi:hypothetical protein COO60DRAFT_1459317 [Scenedesmus sp. NREL 46B-D3]|nr:hypothetical protein COO60DRAFT_1459317 [Scenedesmus sp. NREL 46B-D3]